MGWLRKKKEKAQINNSSQMVVTLCTQLAVKVEIKLKVKTNDVIGCAEFLLGKLLHLPSCRKSISKKKKTTDDLLPTTAVQPKKERKIQARQRPN